MIWPNPSENRFSPYRDPEPWAEFYDDIAQRGTTAIATAFAVHLALFFVLQPSFRMPEIPEDPDTIPVQIIAFEESPAQQDTPTEPEIKTAVPAINPPVNIRPKPKPKPKPKIEPEPIPEPKPIPTPEPEPIPEPDPIPEPESEPIPEPEPEPEPEEILPPPDILRTESSQTPDIRVNEPIPTPPIEEVDRTPPTPEPILEPIPEPIPEPIITDPVISEPIIADPEPFEPTPPDPEPEPEPIPEPEISLESEIDLDPGPLIETEPEPIISPPLPEPIEPEPIEDPQPYISPEATDELPTEGVVIDTPAPIDITETIIGNPEIELTDPIETFDPSFPDPEPVDIPDTETPEILTTAPTILASPEAPTNAEEAERAVPQSQSDPLVNILGPQGQPISGGSIPPNLGGPTTGGGNIGGGTRRPTPGSGGWTLDPGSYGNSPSEGYEGLIKDTRCREKGRTHEDCPDYVPKFQGRNTDGYESFGAHSTGNIATRSPRATTPSTAIGGGTDPWALGIGNNSMNAGGPSGSVLDDADFGRTFIGTPLGDGSTPDRVRDLLEPVEDPWSLPPELLPLPEETAPPESPDNSVQQDDTDSE